MLKNVTSIFDKTAFIKKKIYTLIDFRGIDNQFYAPLKNNLE